MTFIPLMLWGRFLGRPLREGFAMFMFGVGFILIVLTIVGVALAMWYAYLKPGRGQKELGPYDAPRE